MVGGILHDRRAHVFALEPETGKLLWKCARAGQPARRELLAR
jgi:hypothetical protein